MLDEKEKNKLEIIKRAISGQITNAVAGKLLFCSARQIRRIKASVRKTGSEAVVHKLKGRISNNSFRSERLSVIDLVKTKYSDFGPTLLSEKLSEIEGITVKPETLRLWMVKAGMWKVRKRRRHKYFSFRERKDYFGEMLQFDGSYHKWFEDRLIDLEGYPIEVCLLASIDDATGIINLKLDMNESVFSVFRFWKNYLKELGKPISIYLDKYSTYKVNFKNAVDNIELLTQFQKALNILDIKMISANTPQAKGRVERLFQTLQDRLVKELRLNNISTIESGNTFLKDVFVPKFNKKFSVIPNKTENLHRKLTRTESLNLRSIFSVKNIRIVHNDFTIKFKGKLFQLEKTQPVTIYQRQEIQIEEHLDNKIKIKYKDKYLNYFTLKHKPPKQKLNPLVLTAHKINYIPPPNHPWRKYKH